MPLQKQPVPINFSQGLDTKTDPNQVPVGKFLSLENAVFDKGGRLEKRNGFGQLTTLPDASSKLLTTFNGNLTAIGTSLEAYIQGSETWANKGSIQIASVSTLPLIRNSTNQTQADAVVAPNGLVCTAYIDTTGSATSYKYVIADSQTGQNIVAPTAIPVATGAITGAPRTFLLGNYFVIVFTNTITAVPHLQYVAINYNNLVVTANTDISPLYTPTSTLNFDGIVVNDTLYLAWNGNDGGGAIRACYISSGLVQNNTVVYAGSSATFMSLTADNTGGTPVIYITWGDSSHNGYTIGVNQILTTVLAKTQIITTVTIANLTSSAQNGVLTAFYEVVNNYGYSSGGPTNYVASVTCTSAGVVGTPGVVLRSVGLASKSFIVESVIYMLSTYSTAYQPTYFLINSLGQVIAKLAYSNGGGYLTTGLPGVSVEGAVAQIPYLFRDAVIPVNKSQGIANAGIVFAQTGINLATFNVAASSVVTSEVGNDLHLSGGFMWMYDGYAPVEHSFHLFPDLDPVHGAVGSTTGGTMTAQQYYYQATYEWADNQGNIHRSAPSIPITVTTTGSTSSVVVNVPTLRLTYKTANPVKIVLYRWSVAQQTYYQVTSVSTPILNRTNIDYLPITDTQPDSAIVGNSIIYTTGGVVEDDAAPATNIMTLFKSRLVLVDAEDPNLLWYSKQVIEATPVEMSALFTIYVAPTISAQGNTGPITALSAMDDKLIIFKKDAIYYITGSGPDNTGANNDFSDPVFITSTVGCANQQSIVFMPQGLMFQSDKGIWLLGRDLSTTYIGAPVEAYNSSVVQSAVNIPATNQVRFTLSSGVTLMFDYYYGQWGTFNGISAISSTLYASLHTYIDAFGKVFQETPGYYLDGSRPVLLSFTTSWFNLAGLQGFQRAYFFYLLATYISPHRLQVQVAYDYDSAVVQTVVIEPDNYNAPYGSDAVYGEGSPYGGSSTQEPWRVFLNKQKCESVQITVNEIFDASFGVPAGAGLTLSGLNMVVGLKSGYPRRSAARSVG